MPKQVRLPDGQIGFFGDLETPEEIRGKIEKKFPDAYKGQGELAARGAARGVVGDYADAARLSHLPGVGALFPPAGAWDLASKIPGDPLHTGAAEKAATEFANAPTPSGAEWLGWAGSQVLPALVGPTGLTRPLTDLASAGLKKGGKYALGKFGVKEAEKAAPKVAEGGAALGPKPKLRMKADGSIVEVDAQGREKSVTQWTKRQMEKRELQAKGQPTSSTAFKPGEKLIGASPDAEHAELKAMMHEAISDHTMWAHAKHLAKLAHIPNWMALGILTTRAGRNVAARGIRAGAVAGGRTQSGENPPDQKKTERPDAGSKPQRFMDYTDDRGDPNDEGDGGGGGGNDDSRPGVRINEDQMSRDYRDMSHRGEHADFNKFERSARPSSNIEDTRFHPIDRYLAPPRDVVPWPARAAGIVKRARAGAPPPFQIPEGKQPQPILPKAPWRQEAME